MKFWITKYQLPKQSGGRKGFLLQVLVPGQKPGYADCFSWPELGDPSQEELLFMLQTRNFKESSILSIALKNAKADGLARSDNKRRLPENFKKVTNHFFLGGISQRKWVGFQPSGLESIIKVKLNSETTPLDCKEFVTWAVSTSALAKVRLDLNGKWQNFYEQIFNDLGDKIDFVEDPFPTVDQAWNDLQIRFPNVELAVDFAKMKDNSNDSRNPLLFQKRTRIIKPSRDSDIYGLVDKSSRCIFTSYLGHPIGWVHDMARLMSSAQLDEVHGMSRGALNFWPQWAEALLKERARSEEDHGVGGSSLLRSLNWQSI